MRIALSAPLAVLLAVLLASTIGWLFAPVAQAEGGAVYRRTVELHEQSGAAAFPLPAAAGETWTLRVEGARATGRLAVLDPRSGEIVAQAANAATGLRWTAPETGIWQVSARGDRGFARQPITLVARREADLGGAQGRPVAIELTGNEPFVAQGVVDWPGDEDWFAVGMSAGNRYVIYTALGTLGGTRGDLLLPGEDAASPLWVHENGKTLYREVSPKADGVAVIRITGASGGVGSYALGVTPRGDGRHPPVAATAREEHVLRGAEARAAPGRVTVDLRGDWGAFDAERRAGVWLDTDADGDWDLVAVTRDGWATRVWSIDERRWLDGATAVSSHGFDSLVLQVSTRGFGERVRWRAAVRRSTVGWRSVSGAAGFIAPQPPAPQRSALWPISERGGTPQQRAAALAAAGVGTQRAGQPIVVLDPGHGAEETGPIVNGIVESRSNMALAREVAALLRAAGVHVVLTRDGDTLAQLNFSGAAGRADLHARIELAHAAQADLFVSLHSNAAHNDWQRGLESWYYPSPAGDGINRDLARWMLDAVGASLAEWGYRAPGITYDAGCWEIVEDACDPIYVLAPFLLLDRQAALDWGCDPDAMELSDDPWGAPLPLRYPTSWAHTKGVGPIDLVDTDRQVGPASVARGTMMPAVLLELLYMTHESDAAVLRGEGGRAALARGVADGILSWLRGWGQLPSE